MDIDARDGLTLTDAVIRFFTAPFRLRTYTNVLYLLLAFPLGLIYFVFLAVGLSTGFGLVVVWIGIPILAMVFAGSWGLAALERQLAIHGLGATVPPMALAPATEMGFWQRVGAFFSNPVTWKGMAFLLLKFPLGIVSFIAVVTLLATTAGFLLAPVVWAFGGDWGVEIDFVYWTVDSLAGSMVLASFGVVLFFVSLNLLNGLALVWRWAATFLLGSDRFAPAAPAPPMLPEPAAA